jgi:hypothetical protein
MSLKRGIFSALLALTAGFCGCRRQVANGNESDQETIWNIQVGEKLIFSPKTFSCAAGQSLRIRVKNTIPVNGPMISHSLVVLLPETDVEAFGRGARGGGGDQD